MPSKERSIPAREGHDFKTCCSGPLLPSEGKFPNEHHKQQKPTKTSQNWVLKPDQQRIAVIIWD
eukprot:2691748-Amphidinium_carterae.1